MTLKRNKQLNKFEEMKKEREEMQKWAKHAKRVR